nr:MAG TPA: stabilization protein [Caudoviricetes sp.]
MRNRQIKVWDLNGNPKKVNIKDDAAYLEVQDPNDDFRAVTVADYTFILNRNKTV